MADPVVGSFSPRPYLPPCEQPGGIGTAVTPAQGVDERTGKFFPGCGHSINSWDVHREAVAGVAMAIVRCPICGYVQSIQDLSIVNDNDEVPIIFG